MRSSNWSWRLLVLALVSLLVLLSACQQAAPPAPTAAPKTEKPATPKAEAPPAKAEKAEVAQLKIGTLPISAFTPLFTTDKLGFFKDEGLEVELVKFGGGAEMLPALQAGKLQFAASNYVSAILGRAEGLDFYLVSNFEIGQSGPPDLNGGLWVKKDSPITNLKQLEGKRVAVNNINSLAWLTVRETIKKNGGDPDKVQFLEVPYPQVGDAVLNGQVDAGYTPAPFSLALNEGGKAKLLAWVFVETQPKLPLVGIIGSEAWVKKNPITTKKVVNAIKKGIEATNKSEEEGRKLIVEFTKMDPSLAAKIPFHVWSPTIDAKSLQAFADVMYDHKMMKQKFDVSKLVMNP